MFYQHHSLGGSAVSALPPRRGLSLWGLGAAAGLLSFPLRARSGEAEPDSVPDGPELTAQLCPAPAGEPAGGGVLALLELCDSPAEAASSRDPALLSVLGGDVRPGDLPGLPVLSQAPASEGTAASGGGGLFGLSGTGLALAGGGGLLLVAALASGGSDSDDSSGGGGGGGGGNGGSDSNSAPMVTTLAMASLTVDEAAAETWDVTDWFEDPDTEDTLTYVISGNPSWLELDDTKGELTIAANATGNSDVDSHTFTLTASDDDDETAVFTVTLTVEDVEQTPVVVTTGAMAAPATLAGMETGSAQSHTVSTWFSDPDGDVLTFALAAGAPSWATFDAAMGVLSLAFDETDDADVGMHTLVLTASDTTTPTALTASHTVVVTVENTNEAPVVVTGSMAPPTTITAMEGGAAQSFTLATWFTDEDTGDTLTFALAAGGPDWATFDTAMGFLNLAFDETDDIDVGSHELEVIATDSDDLSTTHTVTLAVSNVAEDPTVVTAAAPATLTAMEVFAADWDVATWFADPDLAAPGGIDALTYTAMELQGSGDSQMAEDLPEWLVLNDMTGALTIAAGMTDNDDVGTYTLAVTASDKADAMASHTTTLEITDTVTKPTLSTPLPNQIAPATGMTLTLDLTDFFTDIQEDSAPGTLTFEVSSSIPDTMEHRNVIAADLTGAMMDMLELTPGMGDDSRALWKQETVAITATDSDNKETVAAFVVTTRPNVLDVGMLAPAHGFVIQGDRAGDELGTSVSGAGDVNGDGLADLIVGAPKGSDRGTEAGEAYIVYGKANLADKEAGTQFGLGESGGGTRRVLEARKNTRDDGFVLQGDTLNDALGISVSGAGDINGDGLADLIVGANKGEDGGSMAGEAYIVYGKTNPAVGHAGTQFGVAIRLDENGDVVLPGAPLPVSSVERQIVDTTTLAPADGFILQGVAGDKLGGSVAGAGDVNGDGIDDLIVGASGDIFAGSSPGRAYIVYGKAGTGSQFGTEVGTTGMERQVLDTTNLAPAAGFIIQGDIPFDQFGWSVSGAGDVNGDGLDDLIVGTHEGDDGGNMAGEAYIVYGEAGATGTQFGTADSTEAMRRVVDTTNFAPADGFIIQGDAERDELGRSVSGAGDINGDGFDDLIVGALGGDDGGNAAGEAYIIYGKANPAAAADAGTQFGTTVGNRQVLDTTNLSVTDGFILQGNTESEQLGSSVSGAGDVNGDGLADLIVGAWLSDVGETAAGVAYIIYGKAGTDGTQFGSAVTDTDSGKTRQVLDTTGGLEPTDGFIIRGDAAADQLGGSVSGAGDVNGDGFDDLIAGARKGDDIGSDAGEAYVVFGGAHLGEVVSYAQTLVGMAVPELAGDATAAAKEAAARMAFLHGGAGDDTLTAHADTTVLYGGAGDDVLELADATFRRVDGGSGDDTLVLGSGVVLDFTEASDLGRVRGIETLSLSDATAMVTLDLVSVYALVESRDNGGTLTDAGEAFLRLEGVGMVVLEGGVAAGAWTLETMDAEGTSDLYAQGSAKLLIDDALLA